MKFYVTSKCVILTEHTSLRVWNCERKKCIGSVFEEIGLGMKTEKTISKKLTSHLGLLGNSRFLCLLYKHSMSSWIYQHTDRPHRRFNCTHCSAPLQRETQTLHLSSGPYISAPCHSSCFQGFPSPVSNSSCWPPSSTDSFPGLVSSLHPWLPNASHILLASRVPGR